MTREPEIVEAYRDTWELGLHSYLTYLRDRLLVERERSRSGFSFRWHESATSTPVPRPRRDRDVLSRLVRRRARDERPHYFRMQSAARSMP
jgi:hypothetical protein